MSGRSGLRHFTPQEAATVLIIDDTRATRDALARSVEEAGHKAITADAGMEGLRLLREAQPSIVLVDVEMPGFDGYKVAAAVKQQPRFVPVVLITARTDLEAKRRAQAAGADDFLSKPVQPLELQIRIAAMLRIKSLTDQLDAANRRLAELAETDGLTQIANRRRFDQLFSAEHQRADRYRRPLSLAIADIDFFKRINDTHGHTVGDVALRMVAHALAETLRQSDHVARLGGEEFGVIAPEVGAAGGFTLGERLRRRIEQVRVPRDGGEPFTVTVSIGVATMDGVRKVSAQSLYKLADEALYQAKQSGRNRVVLTVAREEQP